MYCGNSNFPSSNDNKKLFTKIVRLVAQCLNQLRHRVHSSSYKIPVILVRFFNETWIFATAFWKILKYKISWKSVRWKPSCSLRRADRQTDRHDEANSRFSQFFERA
jgi:hypothetical protein